MLKKAVFKIVMVIFILAGLAILFTWRSSSSSNQPSDIPATSHKIKIQRGNIENAIQASGVFQPFKKLEVGVQVSGQIESLLVKLGDQVKKGDLLAVIDPTIATNELHEKESSLAQQKAELATRQLDLAQAHRELGRQRRLAVHEAISRVELEESELKFRRAGIALEAVKAQVRQSEAAVESAQTKLRYTQIKAPIDGDIINIAAQAGQTLIAAQQVPVLMTIAQLDKLMVVAQVPEADISKIYKGQEVYFTTLNASNKPVWGKVEAIRPTAKNVKDAIFYEVISSLPNTDRKLLVDMSVQISFVFKTFKNVLVIPLSAVGPKHPEQDTYPVLVAATDGKTVQRFIKLGSDDHIQAQVIEGLKEGELVVDPYTPPVKESP